VRGPAVLTPSTDRIEKWGHYRGAVNIHVKHPFGGRGEDGQQYTFICELLSRLLRFSSLTSVFSNACNKALCRRTQLWTSWLSRFRITITPQFTSEDDKERLLNLHHSNDQTSGTERTPVTRQRNAKDYEGWDLSDVEKNDTRHSA